MPSLTESTLIEAEKALEGAKAPAILCSFGKDSTVLLHLFRHLKLTAVTFVPAVLNHAEWEHGLKLAQDWGVPIYGLNPESSTIAEKDGLLAVLTKHGPMAWQQSVRPGTACLKESLINREPQINPPLPFDYLLCGQKNGDPNFLGESFKDIPERIVNAGLPTVLYPLRDWTDADVWDYIDRHNIPVDPARYDVPNRKEHDVTVASNDRVHGCVACIDPRNRGLSILCPKTGTEIPCIAA